MPTATTTGAIAGNLGAEETKPPTGLPSQTISALPVTGYQLPCDAVIAAMFFNAFEQVGFEEIWQVGVVAHRVQVNLCHRFPSLQ